MAARPRSRRFRFPALAAASSRASARPRSVPSAVGGKSTSRSDRSGVSLISTRAKPQTAAPTTPTGIGVPPSAKSLGAACCAPVVTIHSGIRLRAAAAASDGNSAIKRAACSVGSSPSSATSTAISPTAAVSFEASSGAAASSANAAGSISLTRCPARSSCSRRPGSRQDGRDQRDRQMRRASPASGWRSAWNCRSLGARPQNTELGHGPPATASGAGRIEPGDRQLDAPIPAGSAAANSPAPHRRRCHHSEHAAEHQIPQRVRLRLDGDQQPARRQQIAQARTGPPCRAAAGRRHAPRG